mgnify:CR=1 FL=1
MPATLPSVSPQLKTASPHTPSNPEASTTRVLFRSLGQSPVQSQESTRVFRLDQPIIITIDGPAGTGKSSVARQLAQKLGLDFLDTGAMYRAAAAIAIDQKIAPVDEAALVRKVMEADLHFDWHEDPPAMLAWGKPINHRIRDLDVTSVVSPIAGIATLREHMVMKQRIIARQHPRLVSEGRDQGSVVFPDAHVKFFLTASVEERARRRAQQLIEGGQAADVNQLAGEIDVRDKSDMNRKVGPLTQPVNAVVLDTSALNFAQVVDELERIVRKKSREP